MKEHLAEATHALGYINPEHLERLQKTIDELPTGLHPAELARRLRKREPQLSADEKRKAGIRANSFFSAELYSMMTEKGRERPAHGLEQTLLRASLAAGRDRVLGGQGLPEELRPYKDHLTFRLEAVSQDCPGCKDLDDREVSRDQARALIPPPNCAREACGIGVQASVDWIGAELSGPEESSRPKGGWLSRLFRR